jgi:hypothetical protein
VATDNDAGPAGSPPTSSSARDVIRQARSNLKKPYLRSMFTLRIMSSTTLMVFEFSS